MRSLQKWPASRHAAYIWGPDAHLMRKATAEDLLAKLSIGSYDSETLKGLLQIFEHDFLCHYMKKLRKSRDSSKETDVSLSSFGDDFCEPAFETPWLGRTLEALSAQAVDYCNETSHLERELIYRNVLAVFTLLRAYNVDKFSENVFKKVRNNLANRFKELKWQSKKSGDLSPEVYRKIQSAYYLSANTEFSHNFARAKPLWVQVFERFSAVVAAGSNIAGPALGGGSINLPELVSSFNIVFGPRAHTVKEEYTALFNVRELATLSIALRHAAKIALDSRISFDAEIKKMVDDAEKSSLVLANQTLQTILGVVPDIEILKNIKPPSSWLEHGRAFAERPASRFDAYHFVYGLIECAIEVCRYVEGCEPPENLLLLMWEASQSNEASIRWKAIEFILLYQNWWARLQKKSPLGDVACQRLSKELELVRDALDTEKKAYPQALATPDSTSVSSNSSVFKIGAWMEQSVVSAKVDPQASSFTLDKQWSKLRSDPDTLAFLSPNCESALIANKKGCYLYNIAGNPPSDLHVASEEFESREKKMWPGVQVDISNRFLAIVSDEKLRVISITAQKCRLEHVFQGSRSRNQQWHPKSVAIRDAGDRTWIAIAGETRNASEITIFVVHAVSGSYAIEQPDVPFNDYKPHALVEETVKSLSFSADGAFLCCITRSHKAILWPMSDNGQHRSEPFVLPVSIGNALNNEGAGVSSVTTFTTSHEDKTRPYLFATIKPSDRRDTTTDLVGEWPFFSPVAFSSSEVPRALQHSLGRLLRDSVGINVGAVAPIGSLAAVMQENGTISVIRITGHPGGGLGGADCVHLSEKLNKHKNGSLGALRFHLGKGKAEQTLSLVAIDPKGKIVKKIFRNEEVQLTLRQRRDTVTSIEPHPTMSTILEKG